MTETKLPGLRALAHVAKDQDGYFIEVNDSSELGPKGLLPLGTELCLLEDAKALDLKLATSDYAYDSSMTDIQRLVRELDALLNGESGAAQQASLCDIVGQVASVVRERGMPLLSAPPAAGVPEAWQPMETAPKDGTLLRLLVKFEDHPIDDGAGPFATVGTNYRDNTGEDIWQIVGWCWEQDRFIDGVGTPIGWLPMLAAAPTPPASEQQQAVVMPDEVRALLSRARAQIEHLAECTENLGEDLDDDDVSEDVAEARAVAGEIDELLRLNPHLAKGEGV